MSELLFSFSGFLTNYCIKNKGGNKLSCDGIIRWDHQDIKKKKNLWQENTKPEFTIFLNLPNVRKSQVVSV